MNEKAKQYEDRCDRMAEALRNGADWFHIDGGKDDLDRIVVVDGNYLQSARLRSVGKRLGWNSPLRIQRDDMTVLVGKPPIATLPTSTRVYGGATDKVLRMLQWDISSAMRDSYERTVDKTLGRVRFVFEDDVQGSRIYRYNGKGVLVHDAAGDGDVLVGQVIFFYPQVPVNLPDLFAVGEQRLLQSEEDKAKVDATL